MVMMSACACSWRTGSSRVQERQPWQPTSDRLGTLERFEAEPAGLLAAFGCRPVALEKEHQLVLSTLLQRA